MVSPNDDEVFMARSLVTALSEATSEGVMVLDPDFRIVSINKGACRRTGTTPEEARGRFCFQVSHQAVAPCDSPETPCPMRETLATGRAAHAIHEHLHADGEAHYCDVSTYPLHNPQGEVVGVLEIFRDITNELSERMERRTRAIKDDLARLVQEDRLVSLGKLVASVAHEINNPIGSILNFSKLILVTLQEGPPSPETLEQFEQWLALTVREARRCGSIVSNLLSFARQQSVDQRRVDLRELLRQILMLTDHRMELCGVTPKVTLPDEPLEVWGDATQIQQCLTNLVFNAVEAMEQSGDVMEQGGVSMEQGGVSMEQGGVLTVSAGRDSGEVWVEIADTGPGISDSVLPHIFEPFFTTKSVGRGVGLGLSMVHGIVCEHQGRIDVDPGLGKGATFRMILPQAESVDAPPEES